MSSQASTFRSVGDLVGLIQEYEAGTLAPELWNHPTRLALAVWYLVCLPEHGQPNPVVHATLRKVLLVDDDRNGRQSTALRSAGPCILQTTALLNAFR